MNLKEWIRFLYGMALGTSVPYIKPQNRFLWPTAIHKFDANLSLYLGGSSVCGILTAQNKSLLINTNSGEAANKLAFELNEANIPFNIDNFTNSRFDSCFFLLHSIYCSCRSKRYYMAIKRNRACQSPFKL